MRSPRFKGAHVRGCDMRQNPTEAKAQASKIAEIRNALVSAGCDTTGKQAAALGVGRSTAHALLNRDRRAGPSARVVKRVLSSPTLPVQARRKFEEYVEDKIHGRYGHSERRAQAFRNVLREQRNH